jgi:hypothetical protein
MVGKRHCEGVVVPAPTTGYQYHWILGIQAENIDTSKIGRFGITEAPELKEEVAVISMEHLVR